MSRYYNTDCCGVVTPPCPCPDDVAPVTPLEKCSFSHEFCGNAVIDNAALLAISGKGGVIHSVDIDLRCDKNSGAQLVRGGASDTIFGGGSRDWDGGHDSSNNPLPSNDFELTLDDPGECAVISWTEIV